MFNFFNKSEDDGPVSPPIKGSWEFNFNNELKQAVKKREKHNKKLEEDINARKISSESTCSVDSRVSSISSNYSQGSTQSTYHTPLHSPQQVYPVTPQFTFSTPKTSTSSLTPPNVSPPLEIIPQKSKIVSCYSSSAEGHKSNTVPSNPNLRLDSDLTGGKRKSLALDKRGKNVLELASMFTNVMQVEEDPSKSLRKRSTTVSTSQTDINSSKIPSKINFKLDILNIKDSLIASKYHNQKFETCLQIQN